MEEKIRVLETIVILDSRILNIKKVLFQFSHSSSAAYYLCFGFKLSIRSRNSDFTHVCIHKYIAIEDNPRNWK